MSLYKQPLNDTANTNYLTNNVTTLNLLKKPFPYHRVSLQKYTGMFITIVKFAVEFEDAIPP